MSILRLSKTASRWIRCRIWRARYRMHKKEGGSAPFLHSTQRVSLPPHEGRLGAVATFAKSNKRGMRFFFGKAWKERFSFHEKHKRTFLCYFLWRAKSNQKARGTSSCDLGSKLYTGVLFIEIIAFRVWNSFQALNRCEREAVQQMLGRVKSCRWQVLTCRRPPKQGSIVSGREQDDHVSRRLSLNIQILTLVG